MRKNTFATAFPVAATLAALALTTLMLAPVACESSGPITATGSSGSTAGSRPRPGTSDGGGAVPTETPVGYPGPRPTPTAMPSNIPPTPAP